MDDAFHIRYVMDVIWCEFERCVRLQTEYARRMLKKGWRYFILVVYKS